MMFTCETINTYYSIRFVAYKYDSSHPRALRSVYTNSNWARDYTGSACTGLDFVKLEQK
jgi:hypothetical protein